MTKSQSLFKTKLSLTVFVFGVIFVGSVFTFIPRKMEVARSENCTNQAPTVATLNPFPITWDYNSRLVTCNDYAPIAVTNTAAENYSSSAAAWPGEELSVSIYVHDGAQQGLDEDDTTARNVHGNIFINGKTISTSFSGSNTNTKTGSVNIDLPLGGSLQFVPGSGQFLDAQKYLISGNDNLGNTNLGANAGVFDMGDMRACFEFAKFYRFRVRVVAPPVQPQPTGRIGALLKDQDCPATTRDAIVSWTVNPDVKQSAVYVTDNNGAPQYFSGLLQAENVPAQYLTPEHTYTFILYNVITPVSSEQELGRTKITIPKIDCGGGGGPTPSGTITVDNPNQDCSSGTFNTPVRWSVQNVSQAAVYVSDNNQTPQYFSGLIKGPQQALGLQPRHTYTFILYNVITPGKNEVKLDNISLTIPPLSCGGGSNLVCVASPTTANVNQDVTFTATGGSAPYNWFSEAGVNDGNGQSIALRFSYGPKRTMKVVDGDGKEATCSVTINTPPPQPPNPPTIFTATATATASASATVVCPDGTTATATATATAFATASSNISQADAKNKAQAQAQANAESQAKANAEAQARAKCPNNPPPCVSNANFALNASAPTKTGSTYSTTLTWSSTGNHQIKITQVNPGSTSEINLTTGPASGSFNAGGLQAGSTYIFKMYDANCGTFLTSTQVITPGLPGQLICFASASAISPGQAANFTLTGGAAPYNWSGDGNPASGSGPTYNPVYNNASQSAVTHTVQVSSSDGQTTSCSVIVNGQPSTGGGGGNNCTNNSCNTTTTNTCVNNSCSTVYITSGGNVVPANQFSQLSITKQVRNFGSGSFQNTVTANNGESIEFQIVIRNSGNYLANNVRINDNLPSGLSFVSGNFQNDYYIGNLNAGDSRTITFQARVNTGGSNSIQNIATATSDNAGQVSASAWVFVNTGTVAGGNVSLTYSKRAFNQTKNSDATSVSAAREDYITYTLTVTNNGNSPANNFVMTDDLSQVLPYSDIVDNGGGTLNGNVINYPGITVPQGGSVSKSFKVRVKFALAGNLSYVMTNTYGNTVTVKINSPQVLGAFTAPKTGADTLGFTFASVFTAAAVVVRKRKYLFRLIFT